MKRTIEELRAYARQENAAYKKLESAGFDCWGAGERGVMVERYREGENRATHFPAFREYFKDWTEAAEKLLSGDAAGKGAEAWSYSSRF